MPCTFDRSEHTATITFGSPTHNALSSELLHQLTQRIHSLDHEPSVKGILLKSEGDRTFCAGADLNELLLLQDEVSATAFFSKFAQLILAIRNSPHLILCSVQGKAIGGAVGIIAAADYVIATDQAQVRLSELINGIGPFVVGPAIERKMGLAALQHMALSPGEWQSASFALQNGLYDKTVAGIPALDQAVTNKLQEWSTYSIKAMQEIKRMLWFSSPSWDTLLMERSAISGQLIMTKESRAALLSLKS
jgi:methylglutaconyl-CoA hydratase